MLVSLVAITLAAWQRLRGEGRTPDARLVTASIAGLAVHAHFLLIGLTGVVATRYAGAMGPLSGNIRELWRQAGFWNESRCRGYEVFGGAGALSRRFAR